MNSLLSYDSVDICYNRTPVVRNISFSLQPGEILGIVGESGCGKSTIIKAALGILGPGGMVTSGKIYFNGQNLPELPPKEMRRICGAQIGMIFQDSGSFLCPIRTIGKQVYESIRAHTPISRQQAEEKTLKLFNKLNLKNGKRILNSYPFELSGGMNQRVGIAMAMLMNPSILLADEPTSALDASTQKQIVEAMLLLRKMYGTAIILVTHNIGVLTAMADSIIILKDGCIRECGSAIQVLGSPQDDYTKTLLAAVPKLRRH